MGKIKIEITAILYGIGIAYLYQLFMLLLCYLSDPLGGFMTADKFIPMFGIQLAIMPISSWLLMGMMKVTWYEKWLRITMNAISFLIPLALISVVTVFFQPALWREPLYWVMNVVVSVSLGLAFKIKYIK